MTLTPEQREKIFTLFPKQHGNAVVDNDHFLDAVEGRLVLDTVGRQREMGEEGRLYLLMDRAGL